jgi:putative FmdB family regulatory protein
MPTYTYRCKTCDTRFDWTQPMTADPLTTCPAEGGPSACVAPGKGEVTKVFGAVGITFKGSGFYKTDSRAGSGAKAAKGTKGENGSTTKESTPKESRSSSDSKPSDSTSSAESSSSGSGSGGSSAGASSSSD